MNIRGVVTSAGGVGIFYSPFDVIPDFTPIVGYSDDVGAIAPALA